MWGYSSENKCNSFGGCQKIGPLWTLSRSTNADSGWGNSATFPRSHTWCGATMRDSCYCCTTGPATWVGMNRLPRKHLLSVTLTNLVYNGELEFLTNYVPARSLTDWHFWPHDAYYYCLIYRLDHPLTIMVTKDLSWWIWNLASQNFQSSPMGFLTALVQWMLLCRIPKTPGASFIGALSQVRLPDPKRSGEVERAEFRTDSEIFLEHCTKQVQDGVLHLTGNLCKEVFGLQQSRLYERNPR